MAAHRRTSLVIVAGLLVALLPPAVQAQEPVTPKLIGWGHDLTGVLGTGQTHAEPVLTPLPTALPNGVTVVDVEAASSHAVALTDDGRVFAWGSNSYGQLGNGTTTASPTAVEVSIPADVRVQAIAAARDMSMALTSDGRVLAWGDNAVGQLGNGTTTRSTTPVSVALPSGTTATGVATSGMHSVAVTSSGQVYAWGYNWSGELGNGASGSGTQRSTPVTSLLPSGSVATAVAAGNGSSFAVTTTGAVYAWGSNGSGQLGVGSATRSATPVAVQLPTGVKIARVETNNAHVLATTPDQQLFAWGANWNGQLGDGTTTNRAAPLPVTLPENAVVADFSAGLSYSMVVTDSGRVLGWGANDYGQLGDAARTETSQDPVKHPVAVCGWTATAVEAGWYSTLAVGTQTITEPCATRNVRAAARSHGATVSWRAPLADGGSPITGFVVTASDGTTVSAPADARSVVIDELDTSTDHTFTVAAETAGGTGPEVASAPALRPGANQVFAWGDGNYGTLGAGLPAVARQLPGPVHIPAGRHLVHVDADAAANKSAAVDAAGRLVAWGQGPLGDGTVEQRNTPITVALPDGVRVVDAAVAGHHIVVATDDGRVFAWGHNVSGEVGDGTKTPRFVPTSSKIPDGVTVTAVEAAQGITLALTADGKVLSWGQNYLGTGTSVAQSSLPLNVVLPDGVTVTEMAAGSYHRMVLTSDGRVLAWGNNGYGQLGDGTTIERPTPTSVALPEDAVVVDIAAGPDFSLAATADGRVFAWGNNWGGQLGDRTLTQRNAPVEATLPDGAHAARVAGGDRFAVAALADGTAVAWGRGFLGDGVTSSADGRGPVVVDLPAGAVVADVAAGSRHTVVLTSESPPAPRGVIGTAGDAEATVEWIRPPGAPGVTSYTVTASTGQTAVVRGAPPATTTIVEGLTNGEPVTFTVRAANNFGAGAESAASEPVTPAPAAVHAPGAPTDVTATPGDTTVGLAWEPPTGGGEVTEYVVEQAPDADGAPGEFTEILRTTRTTATIEELTNDVAVWLRVVAAGPGGRAPSTPVMATPKAAEGDPTPEPEGPENAVTSVTWRTRLVGASPAYAALGAPLTITAVGERNRHVAASVQYLTWYDDSGATLEQPTVATVSVTLTAQAAAPGRYTGVFTVDEGVAEVTAITAAMTGGGRPAASATASALPVAVAGAARIDLDGVALPGGRAVLTRPDTANGGQVTLGADDHAVIGDLLPGTGYDLRVFDVAGRRAAELDGVAVRSGLTTPVAVTPSQVATVTASVFDPDGQPVRTRVTFSDADGRLLASAPTDASGAAARAGLSSGTELVVAAERSGGSPLHALVASQTITLAPGDQHIDLRFAELPTAMLSGTVVRDGGAPLAGADVVVSQSDGRRTRSFTATTDDGGQFALTALPGAASVGVSFGQESPLREAITLVAGVDNALPPLVLPSTRAYRVRPQLDVRYLGEPQRTEPVTEASSLQYGLNVNGPNGTQRATEVTVVTGRPGQSVELCSTAGLLPERCAETVLGENLDLALPLLLEQEPRVTTRLTTADNTPLEGSWQASLYQADDDGGRRYVRGSSGSGADVSMPVPGDGAWALTVSAVGYRPATRAFEIATGSSHALGETRLTGASTTFASPANSVTALRDVVAPGAIVEIRAAIEPAEDLTDAGVVLDVPAGATLRPASVVLDGEPIVVSERGEVVLGDLAEGTTRVVRYQFRVADDTTRVAATPRVRFAGRDEPLGTAFVRVAAMELDAPPPGGGTGHVALSGRAPAGATVLLYDGAALVGETLASPTGFFTQGVRLPTRGSVAHVLRAEAAQGETVLRSVEQHYDPVPQPKVTELRLEHLGRTVTVNPYAGAARFPFTINPSKEMKVTITFDDPAGVSNAVVTFGDRKVPTTFDGSAFVAAFPAGRLGAVGVEYDVRAPRHSFTQEPPTLAQVRSQLPPAYADFVAHELDPDENAEGSDRAVIRAELPALGDGASLELDMSVSDPMPYTPTAEDELSELATGAPFYGLEFEVTKTEGGLVASVSGYIPVDALPAPTAAAAAAAVLHGATPQSKMRLAAANPAATKEVLKFAAEAAFSGATPMYDQYQARNGGNKYDRVGAMFDAISLCPPAVQDKFRPKIDRELLRAVGADMMGVSLQGLGLLAAPATFGIGTVVIWSAGTAAGLAIDNFLNKKATGLEAEIRAAGCPRPPDDPGEGGGSGAGYGRKRLPRMADPAYIYDPSGFVYEGVASNRLGGVTTTLLYSADGETGWAVWDAEWFGQSNPLTTTPDGRYAWDVPEGFWQVVYERDGYETGYSDVLEVLPPHFDVNEGLVALASPEASGSVAAGGVATVTFDRHMVVSSVTPQHVVAADAEGPVSGSVVPVDAEQSPDGVLLARRFEFRPMQPVAAGTSLEVTVDELVSSYGGRTLAADFTFSAAVPAAETSNGGGGGGGGGSSAPPGTVRGSVAPGGSVSSRSAAVPGAGRLTVTSPQGGDIEIRPVSDLGVAPQGSAWLTSAAWDVTAPPGTAQRPLELLLAVHRDDLRDGLTRSVAVFRDGAEVADCDGAGTLPCVVSRRFADGVLELFVRTHAASRWVLAVTDSTGDPCAPGGSGRFSDVRAGNVHAEAVRCVVARDIARGHTATSYAPAASVTRAQMATFVAGLLRAAGVSLPAGADAFDDDNRNVHQRSINAVTAAGLVAGVGGRRFDPAGPVTRAQMATFLTTAVAFASGRSLPLAPDGFGDDGDSLHAAAIDTAAAAGLARGTSATKFAPGAAVRRDQMASFLVRGLQRLVRDGVAAAD